MSSCDPNASRGGGGRSNSRGENSTRGIPPPPPRGHENTFHGGHQVFNPRSNYNSSNNNNYGRGRWGGGRGDRQQQHNFHNFQNRGRGRGRGRGNYHSHHRGRGRSCGGRHNNNNNNNNNRRKNDRGDVRYNPSAFDPIEEIGLDLDSSSSSVVRIAVEGCCHGELDLIYERLLDHERTTGKPTDLLICCGDFQSLRNPSDFHSSSIPPKFRRLGTFAKYYSGEKVAPFLTVFIGGNHEASQPLRELYYGGWVAPKIYYLGAAGVVRFKGIRIGGISGIYKSHDYVLGHHETVPYDSRAVKSIYHVRNVDVERTKLLSSYTNSNNNQRRMDVFVSHDWPLGIEQHGNTKGLIKRKPFFRQEIERNDLGSPPNQEILDVLKPKHWFSAHLHVKFHATVLHGKNDNNNDENIHAKNDLDNSTPSSVRCSPKSTIPPTSSLLVPSQAGSKGTTTKTKNTKSQQKGALSKLMNQQADALKALFAGQTHTNEGSPQGNNVAIAHSDDSEAIKGTTKDKAVVDNNDSSAISGFSAFDENNAADTAEEEKDTAAVSDNKIKNVTTEFHGLETPASKCIPSCSGDSDNDDDKNALSMNPVQDLTELMTKFLALDKALPRRQFLTVLNLKLPSSAREQENSTLKSKSTPNPSSGSSSEPLNDETVKGARSETFDNNHPKMTKEHTNKSSRSTKTGTSETIATRKKEIQESHLEYDPEWLTILKNTHYWNRTERRPVTVPLLPAEGSPGRWDVAWVRQRFEEHQLMETKKKESELLGKESDLFNNNIRHKAGDDECPPSLPSVFEIPRAFVPTVPFYNDDAFRGNRPAPPLPAMGNPQTDRILRILELDHILTNPYDPELTPEIISAKLQGKPIVMVKDSTESRGNNCNNNGISKIIHASSMDAVDDNEIDIDDENENDSVDGDEANGVDDNEIEIDIDDSDDDGDGNGDENGDNVDNSEVTADLNEINIDEESDEDGDVKAVVKKARLKE